MTWKSIFLYNRRRSIAPNWLVIMASRAAVMYAFSVLSAMAISVALSEMLVFAHWGRRRGRLSRAVAFGLVHIYILF